MNYIEKIYNKFQKFFDQKWPQPFSREELEASRPYTSENTWKLLTQFYKPLSNVRILEYGSGISSFYHLKNLSATGGELVSVEHDPLWHNKLWNSLKKIYSEDLKNFKVFSAGGDKFFKGIDKKTGKEIKFSYLYRPGKGRTGCGTFEEFRSYVMAPGGKFDVIVVDGRARKACVNFVLKKDLLENDGLLALFEAGRGSPKWPKKNQMSGTYDYQPEVNMFLSKGGGVVDGDGYLNWKNWTPNHKFEGSLATFVPMEVCFWVNKR